MRKSAVWSRLGLVLAGAAVFCGQSGGVASAEPYQFASPPGKDSILVFRLDAPTGEVQACGFQSVQGGIGQTRCYPIGEGAGPQQPGSWALHVTNHEGEYGVSRVNPDTGAISYCYLTQSDVTVCTAPLAAQAGAQAQPAPAGKVAGGMPAPTAAPQPAAAAAGEPAGVDGPYRFISPPAINSIRVYRLDTRTGEVVGCEYASVQGGVGETKCYPPGTGAVPNRPGRWALHAASHQEEHGVVRVNGESGDIAYCFVSSDTTVCTGTAQ